MNHRRIHRTTREAFGHPGQAVECYRPPRLLLKLAGSVTVAAGWIALLFLAIDLI